MSERRMWWWFSLAPLTGLFALVKYLDASLGQWVIAVLLMACYGAMCKLEGEAK